MLYTGVLSYINIEEKRSNRIKSHELAKELLSKPDGYITVSADNEQRIIEHIRRISTQANSDDALIYFTLDTKKIEGNVLR